MLHPPMDAVDRLAAQVAQKEAVGLCGRKRVNVKEACERHTISESRVERVLRASESGSRRRGVYAAAGLAFAAGAALDASALALASASAFALEGLLCLLGRLCRRNLLRLGCLCRLLDLRKRRLQAAIVDIDGDIYVCPPTKRSTGSSPTGGHRDARRVQRLDGLRLCGPRVNQSVASLRGGAPRQRKAMREAVVRRCKPGPFAASSALASPRRTARLRASTLRKHGVDFRCVAGACGRIASPQGQCDVHGPFGAVFVVAGFGIDVDRESPDAGVENNSPAELAKWRAQNRGCAWP